MTLSTLLDQSDAPQVDLLKMDIEGSEYETLLTTPTRMLRRIRRINVELHVPDEASLAKKKQTLLYLKECGFAIRRYQTDKAGYGIAFFERI